jgi:hypothetical protein
VIAGAAELPGMLVVELLEAITHSRGLAIAASAGNVARAIGGPSTLVPSRSHGVQPIHAERVIVSTTPTARPYCEAIVQSSVSSTMSYSIVLSVDCPPCPQGWTSFRQNRTLWHLPSTSLEASQ